MKKKLNSFLHLVICFFVGHKWEDIGKHFPKKEGKETMTCYSSLHKCERCGKEEMKGMGCVIW